MTFEYRRPPLRHVVTIAAVVVMAAAVWAVWRGDADRDDTTTTRPTPEHRASPPSSGGAAQSGGAAETVPVAAPAPPPPPAAATPGAVRTVSGPGVAPLFLGEAPPVRVAPPERPKPPPPPIVSRRLGLVKMEDTAHFSVGAIRVRLPGVAVTGPQESCSDVGGTSWPCGRRALAGVRAVVRGKAVDCPLPDKVRQGTFVADCTLAGHDMAERIVASGWARALDRDGPLGEAERRAEAKGLGLHGAAQPIGFDPFPDPGDLPADTTTAPLAGGSPEPRPGAAVEAGTVVSR